MKDFAKSIVCNTKAEAAKVGNIKPGDTGYVWRGIPREKYKVKILKVDDGWARFVFINGEFKGQEDEELISQIKAGNKKVGNASTFDKLDDAVHYASNLTDDALRRLNGTFSATNLISALSKCKQACDDAIKLAQQYDREINK